MEAMLWGSFELASFQNLQYISLHLVDPDLYPLKLKCSNSTLLSSMTYSSK